MTKNEFLNKLKAALSGLPQSEMQKTMDYYSEIIDDAVEEGEDEQSVIARLGNIEDIAEKIINETPIRKFVKEDVKKHNISVPVIVLIIIGSPIWLPILVSIAAVLFSLYLTIWSLIASLFVISASLALSGIATLILSVVLLFVRPLKAMLSFGTALACIGLLVFMFYLSVWCAKMIIKLTVFMVRKTKDIFIRKGSEVK